LGLLAMFYISSYTVKERDETQLQLYQEQEKHLLDRINHEKETSFTKRIYHTHHKAEKVMGFIKEDLRRMNPENIEEINYRVTKYANFISRVIYDMKWYDPPVQTIRNPLFKTDLNEVIKFIVQNLFLRISDKTGTIEFKLNLGEDLPKVSVNEFVVWEILEPLIQNSIDHGGDQKILITIQSKYYLDSNRSEIKIFDNGRGIPSEMLSLNEKGIKKIFLENISSKENKQSSGYGCYLAYEISKQRCGWDLDVENFAGGGCCFTIKIPNE
jgi:signal transduction histidine kinase